MTKIAMEGGRFSQTALTSRDREALETDQIYLFIYLFLACCYFICMFFFSNKAASHPSAITHKKVSMTDIIFNGGGRFSKEP